MRTYYDEKIIQRGVNTATPAFIEYDPAERYPWFVGILVDENLDKGASRHRPCQAVGASEKTLHEAIFQLQGLENETIIPRGITTAIRAMARSKKLSRFMASIPLSVDTPSIPSAE